MNDIYLDHSSDAFWEGVRARLLPVLGDLPGILGEDWMDLFETCFRPGDFYAVAAAAWNGGERPGWIEIEIPDTEYWDPLSSFVAASVARTMPVGLACLSRAFLNAGLWPDAISGDPGNVILEKDGKTIARLRSLKLSTVSAADRDRALGTLTGLRKHESASTPLEFEKRARRWPELDKLQLGELDRGNFLHFPVPSEWLASARHLCRLTGIREPNTDLTHRVAAFALGAPTWNHLVADQRIQAASAYCPWHVLDCNRRLAAFADPFEAFADLARRARHWMPGKTDVELAFSPYGNLDLPEVGLREKIRFDLDPKNLMIQPMAPAVVFESDAQMVREIYSTLKGGDVAQLGRFFGLHMSKASRLATLDEMAEETYLAEDGPYRLTVSERRVHIRKHAIDGTIVWGASVAGHRGAVWRHPSGIWVMTEEYRLDKPVGALPELGRPFMKAIEQVLHSSMEQPRGDKKIWYPWQGTAADQALYDAAEAMARGQAVDLTKIDFYRYRRQIVTQRLASDGVPQWVSTARQS